MRPTRPAVPLLLGVGSDPSAATTQAAPRLRNLSAAMPIGTTPLQLAAARGNAPLLLALLNAKADVRAADAEGNTALHFAASGWSSNAVELLIRAKAPLNVTNLASQTPLRRAVESGSFLSAGLLLDAGANPTNGLNGDTLLHLAAARGDLNTAKMLLARKFALDAPDAKGQTPFQRAVLARQYDLFKRLLDEGARLSATDQDGNTILHLQSAQQEDMFNRLADESWFNRWHRERTATPGFVGNTLRWFSKNKLLSAPTPPRWTNTSLTIWLLNEGVKPNATNLEGQTPLHVMCGQQWLSWDHQPQNTNRLVALLEAGARLDLADTNGLTPLHIAATNASPAVLAFLVKKAGKGVNLPDAQGRTLLHTAMEGAQNNLDRVTVLLVAGADPNVADKQGRTPLHLAMGYRNYGSDWQQSKLVQILLTNGVNPNLADQAGNTPLHLVMLAYTTNYNFQLRDPVALLLTNGANPNLTNRAGQTPLHIFARPQHPYTHPGEHLGSLLTNGPWNFAARDRDGNTPVHLWAMSLQNCWNCNQLFQQILTNNPALVNVTNAAGDTPLHVALRDNTNNAFQNRILIAKALMQSGANPAQKNRRGETPLRLAVEGAPGYLEQEVHPPDTQHRFFDSIRMRNETDVNRWLAADPTLCAVTNAAGLTALQAVTAAGLTNLAVRLIELGAPLDPLAALRLGRLEDFRKLLPGVRPPLPGEWLFEAVRFGQLPGLQALFAAGGDVQFTDDDGHSLLFRARQDKQTEIADWLVAQGCRETLFDAIVSNNPGRTLVFIKADAACVNGTNRNDRTPLYRATAAGSLEIVTLLLEHGAKADAPIAGGWTALHVAAVNDSVELGRLLLKAGADPNRFAQGNLGPLHLTAALGCTNMAELLLQHGADIRRR